MSKSVVEGILPIVTPAIAGIAAAITKAAPSIKAFADVFMKDVQGALVKFKPQIDGARAAIVAVATFITGTAVPAIVKFVKQFADSEGAGGRLRAILTSIGTYITGTFIPAIVGMVKWVGDNKTMVEGFVVMIVAAVVAFQAYTAVMAVVKAATAAWAYVQGVLNGTIIANPIGLIVMAIAALVAGIIWVATKTTFFQDVWSTSWGWITKTAGDAKDWIVGKFNDVVSFFTGLPGQIGNALKSLAGIITAPFRAEFNFVAKLWNETLGQIKFSIPDWVPVIGGKTLSFPQIPSLAEGGIVPATPGGRLVRVAEAGVDEAVVPLPKNGKGIAGVGNGVTHNWYVTGATPEALYAQFKRRENAMAAV
jgi:hypothetical protein